MSFSANKKTSRRSALSQLRAPSRKGPKLYRPPGSFPFPDVRGKVVGDVYLTTKSYLKCVTLCFDDNTELVIDIEPSLSFKANYSDWKSGNQRVIKRWPRIDVTPTPPKNLSRRPLGLYRGQIWIAPDFDAPLMLVEDPEAKARVLAKKSPRRKGLK
jgi:hypothetical protein